MTRLYEAPAYISVYAENREQADRLMDELVDSCSHDPRVTLCREEVLPQEVTDFDLEATTA